MKTPTSQSDANTPAVGGVSSPEGAEKSDSPAIATVTGSTSAADKTPIARPASGPERFIRVGSTVLVTADREEGWWEAKIVEDRGDEFLVLQWVGDEDYPLFLRKRTQMTLLPPDYAT